MYAQNDLEQAFSKMHCPKDGDVWTFLTSVCYKREELAAAGVTITTNDYQRTVLHGISEKLAQFASQVMTAAHITNNVLDTDALTDLICEKAEWMKNHHAKGQGKEGGKKDGEDEALATSDIKKKLIYLGLT